MQPVGAFGRRAAAGGTTGRLGLMQMKVRGIHGVPSYGVSGRRRALVCATQSGGQSAAKLHRAACGHAQGTGCPRSAPVNNCPAKRWGAAQGTCLACRPCSAVRCMQQGGPGPGEDYTCPLPTHSQLTRSTGPGTPGSCVGTTVQRGRRQVEPGGHACTRANRVRRQVARRGGGSEGRPGPGPGRHQPFNVAGIWPSHELHSTSCSRSRAALSAKCQPTASAQAPSPRNYRRRDADRLRLGYLPMARH